MGATRLYPRRLNRRLATSLGSAALVALLLVVGLWALAGSARAAAVSPAVPIAATSPPTISGTPQEGQTLTEGPGSYSFTAPPPYTYTYQWYDCDATGANCAAIAGATGQTYTLTATDVGHTIVVVETATDLLGESGTGTSAPTAVVTGPPVNISPPPTPSGTTQEGSTLTANPGSWGGYPPPSFSYQWFDCSSAGCSPIGGATGQSYNLTAGDVGSAVLVQVSATNGVGSAPPPVSSAQTAVVTAPPPQNVSPPAISGIPQAGQTLSEAHGLWQFASAYAGYQWLSCDPSGHTCNPISGATGQTYTLGNGDVGSLIEVQETVTGPGGTSPPATSTPTQAVVAASAPTPPPVPPPAPSSAILASSSTSLIALPSRVSSDQSTSLVATVASSSGAVPPSGTVTVRDGANPVPGCANLQVTTSGTAGNVTCQAAFLAASSPVQLTAVFTPATGSGISGSSSGVTTVTVGRSRTSVALDVSNPIVKTGARAVYTATVTPPYAGSFLPSGTVEFFDGGKPIKGCTTNQLAASGGHASAVCRVRYTRGGRHAISARYRGNSSFQASGSGARVSVRIRLVSLGTITTTMQWSFHYTPSYTNVLALMVQAISRQASVLETCRGGGCPFAQRTLAVAKTKPCKSKRRGHGCSTAAKRSAELNLGKAFRRRRLVVGAKLTVAITRPGWIGKHYMFQMRARRAPRVAIACLAAGAIRPGRGC